MKKRAPLLGAYAGLDISLAGTGGVLLDAKGEVVSVLAFSASAREVAKAKAPHVLHLTPTVPMGDTKAMWARTVFVAKVVREWLKQYAEPACLVGIEDHAFGARGTSIYQLGHLHGLIRRDLQDADKHWLLIAPTELKAAVTGKGSSDKKAMMAVETPGLDQNAFGASTRNNVVDAYWLARCVHAWHEVGHNRAKLTDIPFTMAAVMKPHAKRKGLASRELLP